MGKRHKQRHQRKQKPFKSAKPPKRQRKALRGRVQKNKAGFAFILSENPAFDDVYVSRDQAYALLDKDEVEYRVVRRGERTSAEIERIISRGYEQFLGRVISGEEGWIVENTEHEWFELESNPSAKALPGDWVICKFVRYPDFRSRGAVMPIKRLGRTLTPKHDIEIVTSRFSLPNEFSRSTMEEAKQWQQKSRDGVPDEAKDSRRVDLTSLPLVTIDGADAKDFDDAVAVVAGKGKTAFVLYVAIADVSFYVRFGASLDRDARERSTSVYFPGVCIPMLPEELSNDLCSLRPNLPRLALTAEIHYDAEGLVLDSRFYESIIQTKARLTYEEVQSLWDRKTTRPELDGALKLMFQLFRKLQDQRRQRGVLDFELPECRMDVNTEGMPTRVFPAPRYASHQLIEEFMIAANSAVAKALRDAPTLFRVHEPPAPDAVEDVNQLLRTLGWNQRLENVSSKSISKLLSDTSHQKGAKVLHQAILRLQKQAHYTPEPEGHFGLALADYTHFTSPIRRYPDLIVHRALKQLIGITKKSDKAYEEELYALGEETSTKERRAMEAERFMLKRKQCWFLKDHVGKRFAGEISGVTERGAFVLMAEIATDGFVPIDALLKRYEFDAKRQSLRPRGDGKALHIGDPLQVEIAKVSVDDNQIELKEVE